MYQYNPGSNSWSPKVDLPGVGRSASRAFVRAGKAYVIGGWVNPYAIDEVWEYDGGADSWTEKNAFQGGVRMGGVAFTIDDRGYFGCGYIDGAQTSEFWEYLPGSDSWQQRATYSGAVNRGGIGFAINSRGFIGMGLVTNGVYSLDFWEYKPTGVGISEHSQVTSLGRVYTFYNELTIVPSSDEKLRFNLFDSVGKLVYSSLILGQRTTLDVDVAPGVYSYQLTDRKGENRSGGKVSVFR